MTQVRVALIGYGKVAHLHAQALKNIPQAAFVAVYGRSYAKAQAFAAQYGVAGYDDLSAMITRERVEAVIVCTTHPAHAEPTVQALQLGAHALVEKPLASTLTDCDTMIAAAHAHGRKLGVISQRRFFEPVRRAKAAIDAGKIGRPVLASVVMYGWRDAAYYAADAWRGTWADEGGGVLVNQAPHQLDLLQWFMGDIESLFGYWGNLNHPYIEVEDTAVAVVRFKSGALANILVSNSQKPGIYSKVHIHGENGATVGMQTDGGAMFIAGMTSIVDPPINDLWTIPNEEHLLTEFQAQDRAAFEQVDATVYYLQLQDQDFIDAILQDRAPAVTGESGRVTVELFTAIYRAQRDGKPVQFPVQAE